MSDEPGGVQQRSMYAPIAAIVVAVLVVGLVVTFVGRDTSSESCTDTSTAGPRATTPSAAFERWWDLDGPAAMGDLIDLPQVPQRFEVLQVGDREWSWEYLQGERIKVEVHRRTAADSYWVAAVNRCSESEPL